jgi:predicted nucleic acid-binding protein
MSFMRDSIFLDTNVLMYAKLETADDKQKKDRAVTVIQGIQGAAVVSIQVLNEFSSVLIKHKVANDRIEAAIKEIIEESVVVPLDVDLVLETWRIRNKYLFSYWDSMIIAAALRSQSKILYSEDLQHEQIIENDVRIINPFHGI